MMKTVRNFGFSNRPMIILLKNQPTVSINGINLYNHIRQSERRCRQDNAVRPFRKLPCVKGHSVTVFDTDPQQSIVKKRTADTATYAGVPLPYNVYPFSMSNEPALIALIENLHNSAAVDFALFDSAGSLNDQALLALFANTDYLLTPFHYDNLTVPSTAVFVAMIVELRRSIGNAMKTVHYVIPNLEEQGVGTKEEKELWQLVNKKLSEHVRIAPTVYKRQTLRRFSTISCMDDQMLVVSQAFEHI